MYYFVTQPNTDAFFNIASEEFLLKHKKDFFIYVWQNAPAVIVGVNQNAFEEVNLSYANSHGIKVVRRLTGGGAVYHDLQNVNYTVIAPYNCGDETFKVFSAPVIEYLNSIGVKAEFSGRNDITVDGKKISGNAETVYKDRIMHHGTLLFKTDMEVLSSVLKPNKFKTESKGIKSVRARVTNVSEYTDVSIETFISGLKTFLKKNYPVYTLSKDDINIISEIAKTKFSTDEWNLNRSPVGKNNFTDKFPFGIFSLSFDTVEGKIQNAEIHGDFFSLKPIDSFSERLNGVKFCYSDVKKAFDCIGEYVVGAIGAEIVDRLFEK